MFNGLWLQAGYPDFEDIAKYKRANFGYLALQYGLQLTDGSVTKLPLEGEVEAFIDIMHANGFKVLAWIQSNSRSPIDLTGWQNAVNQLLVVVQAYGFDGVVTNVEGRTNSDHYDFANFLNGVTAAMHANGKIHITSMVAGDGELFDEKGLFIQLKLDYISPMLYDGADYWTKETFHYFLKWYLVHSPCPVMPGLIAWDYDGRPLSLKLEWIDEYLAVDGTNAGKIAGFKVFWNATLQDEDWNAWINWKCKGVSYLPPPPYEPPATPPLEPVKSGMWVAGECGLPKVSIDKLRSFGHECLSEQLIELYHVDGKDFSAFLRDHPVSRAWVKRLLELLVGVISNE